jgi:hypothetical protein
MKRHTKIFIKREFKSIIGKGWLNFWILSAVFILTIFALEFSLSGLKYLSFKMSDPFINWIEVKQQGEFQNYMNEVVSQKSTYGISNVEANNYILEYVFNSEFKKIRVEGRTIDSESKLLPKILDSENAVVVRNREISPNDYGWIVTRDLMNRLGYLDENHYPLFINYTFPGDTTNLTNLGITNYNSYLVIPIPIMAVVNQLPDLLDFVTPSYFMQQKSSSSKPYNVSIHKEYYQDLLLVVENSDEVVEEEIHSILDKSGLLYDYDWTIEEFELSFRSAKKYRIIIRDSIIQKINAVADTICKNSKIYRFYEYNFDEGYNLPANYLSIMFTDLNKVPDFAKWSKEIHAIRIDMTQIEAKENFNTFNILAWSLCIAISIIAITFIAIFLYFLIDSHFRRISKNLGTIMAFGLGNTEIIRIYLTVFLGLVMISLLTVVALLYGSEMLFLSMQWTREGGLPYFSVKDNFVISALLALPFVSAVLTVIFLKAKLKATPGDLIFERNTYK